MVGLPKGPCIRRRSANLTTAFLRHDEAPCQRGPRQLRHFSRAVTAEPIHKVAYPLSNWGLWPETNSALEIGRIGTGLRDIAWLHRHQLANRRLAYRLLDKPHNLGYLHRLAVADIVDVPRCPARGGIGGI